MLRICVSVSTFLEMVFLRMTFDQPKKALVIKRALWASATAFMTVVEGLSRRVARSSLPVNPVGRLPPRSVFEAGLLPQSIRQPHVFDGHAFVACLQVAIYRVLTLPFHHPQMTPVAS